jgi:predicted amidohydrolase
MCGPAAGKRNGSGCAAQKITTQVRNSRFAEGDEHGGRPFSVHQRFELRDQVVDRRLEQPAHAAANGYFVGAINRVDTEAPWNIGEFYGQSYFCDPRGQIVASASRDKDEVLTADLDLEKIAEVRKTWQFYRDRRPDTYGDLVKP